MSCINHRSNMAPVLKVLHYTHSTTLYSPSDFNWSLLACWLAGVLYAATAVQWSRVGGMTSCEYVLHKLPFQLMQNDMQSVLFALNYELADNG